MTAVQLLFLAGAALVSVAVGQVAIGHGGPRQFLAGITVGTATVCAAAWLADEMPGAAAAGSAALLCALRWRHLERRLDRECAEGSDRP